MKIFLVTIDHGKPALSNKLFDSLVSQSPGNFSIEMVIVENSGRSSIEDYVIGGNLSASLSARVEFAENSGYFGSAAKVIREKMPPDTNWVIVCNNDLSFDPSFFSSLLEIQNRVKQKLLLCPNVIEGNRNVNPLSRYKYPIIKTLFWDFYYKNKFFAELYELLRLYVSRSRQMLAARQKGNQEEGDIYLGHGAIYIISPELIRLNGGLPAETFLYQEESVICGTVRKFGQQPYYLPTLKVYHESHATLSAISFDKDYDMRRSSWWKTRHFLTGQDQ